MIDFKAGETFGDLAYYYRALIQHTYKKSEVDGERIKKTSKKSEPLVYKTDDTNSDNYDPATESKNIQKKDDPPKEKKRVTRILYQWNYETKSHDVIHEYEDGTREIISQDKKDVPGLTKTASVEEKSPGSTRNYSDETKEKVKKSQSDNTNAEKKPREEKVTEKVSEQENKENVNSGIPHDHIKNDMLSIVVTPPPDQKKGQNTTLFERDFSFLNHTNNKTYVSKSGRRIRYSNKNINNSTPSYANQGTSNVNYQSHPPTSNTGNPLSGSTLHKRRTAGGIEVKSSSGRRYPSTKS